MLAAVYAQCFSPKSWFFLFWLFFVTLPFFLGAFMLWILEISFSCHVDWVSKGNLYSSWKFTLNPRKEILGIKFGGKFLQEALVWGENEFWNSLFLLSNFLCVAIVNNNYLTCHSYPVVWNRTTLIRNNVKMATHMIFECEN